MDTKKCIKCERSLDLTEFNKDRTRKDGLRPYCKECFKPYHRQSYANTKARVLADDDFRLARNAQRRKWLAENPEKAKQYRQQLYSKRTPEDNKNAFMKSVYGITLDQYEVLLEKQDGVCAICLRPERRKSRYGGTCRLHVDHDHKTGKLRGLLCSTCNFAIGGMNDSPELLRAAADYLEAHSARTG